MAAIPPPARRYKTTLSCAECRRLKLRCDRVFPCSSCKRRGCASICPDGNMPPSKGNRETPSPLEILRLRVQKLELELAELRKKSSKSPECGQDDTGDAELEGSSHGEPPKSSSEDALAESLGTLSITGYGKSRFFGTTGGAARLLWNIEEDDATRSTSSHTWELDAFNFPREILFLISAFPAPMPFQASPGVWNWIILSLPSQLEAWGLFETFYENGAYIFMPLPRTMFLEQIFSFFYGSGQGPFVEIPRGHRLALLLMVFAIAELLDLTRPATPTGGKRFYYLARAALTLERLYEHPTLTAVQVIVLMMMYLNMSDHKERAELVFVLSGVNLKLSMMLGLHRDSAKFTTDVLETSDPGRNHVPSPAEAELQRTIFHEVVHFELWQALAFGRPSLLHFEQYDCKPPGNGPERDNVHERNHVQGQAWSYGFVRECLVHVLDFTVGVQPPKYSDIIKLDTKIRDYTIPDNVHIDTYENEGADPFQPPSRAVTMLRFSAHSMKEVALLYLHRSCFASAMSDFPDPFSSPFSRSVYSSYQSASNIVSKIVKLYNKEPSLSVRIYLFWGQMFVSCIVLGALVVRCPSCSLAPMALADLDAASSVCQQAKEGVCPATVLPRILQLCRKAHAAFQLYHSGRADIATKSGVVDVSAELSTLVGSSRARPIASQWISTYPAETTPTQRSSTSSSAAPTPSPLSSDLSVTMPSAVPEMQVYYQGNSNWNPSIDAPSLISLEPAPHRALEISGINRGDADIALFAADLLSAESVLQPGILGQEDHLGGYSDVEPTWQSFMQQLQMGFNC